MFAHAQSSQRTLCIIEEKNYATTPTSSWEASSSTVRKKPKKPPKLPKFIHRLLQYLYSSKTHAKLTALQISRSTYVEPIATLGKVEREVYSPTIDSPSPCPLKVLRLAPSWPSKRRCKSPHKWPLRTLLRQPQKQARLEP